MQTNTETYQTILLIPKNEWLALQERLEQLENSTNIKINNTENNTEKEKNELVPYDEACKFLEISDRSLIRAKNQGRIKGVKGHSRGFSYRRGDLIEYKKNFGRIKKVA